MIYTQGKEEIMEIIHSSNLRILLSNAGLLLNVSLCKHVGE